MPAAFRNRVFIIKINATKALSERRMEKCNQKVQQRHRGPLSHGSRAVPAERRSGSVRFYGAFFLMGGKMSADLIVRCWDWEVKCDQHLSR